MRGWLTLIADRYRPLPVASSGGMGDIMHCEDTHLERRVVVKTLQDHVDSRRLLDEQRALSKLRSKHVVQLFDVVNINIEEREVPGLVLEHIEGQDLEIASYKPDGAYIKALWQIACGLSDVHAAGIIHRDIKPNNIRIDNEGVVKILDFGLSRSTGIDDKTRSIIGTPVFMAPELWGQATIGFSSAIDVYAFGITALALITGSVPSPLAQQPPVPVLPAQLAPILGGAPADLADVIAGCLAYSPTQRPMMSEVARVLAKHLLRDKHRALVVMNAKPYELNAVNRSLSLSGGTKGTLSIQYGGDSFEVTSTTGNVFLNNSPAIPRNSVPGCCVITFGVGGNRSFVTFDVSNPEVMA